MKHINHGFTIKSLSRRADFVGAALPDSVSVVRMATNKESVQAVEERQKNSLKTCTGRTEKAAEGPSYSIFVFFASSKKSHLKNERFLVVETLN